MNGRAILLWQGRTGSLASGFRRRLSASMPEENRTVILTLIMPDTLPEYLINLVWIYVSSLARSSYVACSRSAMAATNLSCESERENGALDMPGICYTEWDCGNYSLGSFSFSWRWCASCAACTCAVLTCTMESVHALHRPSCAM